MSKKIRIVGLMLLLFCGAKDVFGVTVQQTLFLNRGNFITVDSAALPAYAFNGSPLYQAQNTVIRLNPLDELILTVINTDTLPHRFAVYEQRPPVQIAPGDTLEDTLSFAQPGTYIYFDAQAFPKYTYLGASGIIAVSPPGGHADFYWNIREHQSSWNTDLVNNLTVSWGNYQPDYFTLNGYAKPDLPNDSSAVVRGAVGDTLRIFVANSGRSLHSIHFHGYHVRIISTSNTMIKDWSKDTVPIDSMEGMIWEIVPDKPGIYPVHDHNLIATTGGGLYPNGIFLMMEIN